MFIKNALFKIMISGYFKVINSKRNVLLEKITTNSVEEAFYGIFKQFPKEMGIRIQYYAYFIHVNP